MLPSCQFSKLNYTTNYTLWCKNMASWRNLDTQWKKIQTLKSFANMVNFLSENGIKDSLIQLADMIVGAALYSVKDRTDASDYINIVKKRIAAEINEL
jgi:hypothetical protein